MRHAAAVDVAEPAQRVGQLRQGKQRVMHPADVGEPAYLGALPGNGNAGLAPVGMHHPCIAGDGTQLLGQKDRGVASARACHQRAKAMARRLLSGKAVVLIMGRSSSQVSARRWRPSAGSRGGYGRASYRSRTWGR